MSVISRGASGSAMWVKICANTNVADARLAADLGADALGFVFAPSLRRVTVAQVAAITAQLPPEIERVGVFTDGSVQEIATAAADAGLTGVQLHGSFVTAFVDELERATGGRISIIRMLQWQGEMTDALRSRAANWLDESGERNPSQRVLLDSSVRGVSGGTGVSFAWADAAASLRQARGSQRIIVAGGLRVENVSEAIAALAPYGVDVASGVELTPGKKDPGKLLRFIERARGLAD